MHVESRSCLALSGQRSAGNDIVWVDIKRCLLARDTSQAQSLDVEAHAGRVMLTAPVDRESSAGLSERRP